MKEASFGGAVKRIVDFNTMSIADFQEVADDSSAVGLTQHRHRSDILQRFVIKL